MASPIHVAAIMASLRRSQRCPRCGHRKPAQARTCAYCGKPAVTPGTPAKPAVHKPGLLERLKGIFGS